MGPAPPATATMPLIGGNPLAGGTTTTGAGQSVGYRYDGAGNLAQLLYPIAGQVVTRTFDSLNRLNGVTDWLGHTTSFQYDTADNLHPQAGPRQTYPNTTTASFTYNQDNQFTGLVDRTNGSPLATYSYGRDPLGQVYTATDPLQGNGLHLYGYDKLNRLTSDQQVAGSQSWIYNAAHDLTTLLDSSRPATTTLSYNIDDQLTLQQQYVGAGITPTQNITFAYNADGDRANQRDSVSGLLTIYGNDQADRLVYYKTSVMTTAATYGYNGDGLRMNKTVSGTTTQQTWDTADGLPLLIQDNSIRYITGPNGLPIEQIDGSNTPTYYYQDQLGSTRGLLNGAGQVVGTYTYSPYGTVLTKTGTLSTPFEFAGQYTDAESGLQYLRARYYDPATSQFLSRDPVVNLTKTPFAYTGDNPLNSVDPSGLAKTICVFGACTVIPTPDDAWNAATSAAATTWHNITEGSSGPESCPTSVITPQEHGRLAQAALLAGFSALGIPAEVEQTVESSINAESMQLFEQDLIAIRNGATFTEEEWRVKIESAQSPAQAQVYRYGQYLQQQREQGQPALTWDEWLPTLNIQWKDENATMSPAAEDYQAWGYGS